MQHGHELDADNAEPDGPGEAITRVLHQAIVPALAAMPPRPGVRIEPRRLVALRPEERMVEVLRRWMPQRDFERFVHAMAALLVTAGAITRIESWFATPERLRERLDDADDLWERVGAFAREKLQNDKGSRPDVYVLGHTHVPDWHALDDRVYVNLGSWTDRATDAVGPFDRTLPALRVDTTVHGLTVTLVDLETDATLQSFDDAHARGRVPLGLP